MSRMLRFTLSVATIWLILSTLLHYYAVNNLTNTNVSGNLLSSIPNNDLPEADQPSSSTKESIVGEEEGSLNIEEINIALSLAHVSSTWKLKAINNLAAHIYETEHQTKKSTDLSKQFITFGFNQTNLAKQQIKTNKDVERLEKEKLEDLQINENIEIAMEIESHQDIDDKGEPMFNEANDDKTEIQDQPNHHKIRKENEKDNDILKDVLVRKVMSAYGVKLPQSVRVFNETKRFISNMSKTMDLFQSQSLTGSSVCPPPDVGGVFVDGKGKKLYRKRTPRMAFLFMVRDVINTEPIWRSFFQLPATQPDGCPAPKVQDPRASVYVHSSPFYDTPPTSIFRPYIIKRRTLASWGSFTVSAGMILLMREALKDPLNVVFSFLSEKCVPVHSFSCTYKFFIHAQRSFVSAWKADERRHHFQFSSNNQKKLLPTNHNKFNVWPPSAVDYGSFWRKGHMWVVLIKKDAQLVSDRQVVGEWVAAHLKGNGTLPKSIQSTMLERIGNDKFFNLFSTEIYREGLRAGNLEDTIELRVRHLLHRPISDEHFIPTVLAAHGREWRSKVPTQISEKQASPFTMTVIQMNGWHAGSWVPSAFPKEKSVTLLRKVRGVCVFGSLKGVSGNEVRRSVHMQLGPPWPEASIKSVANSSVEKPDLGNMSTESVGIVSVQETDQVVDRAGWTEHHDEYGKHCGVMISQEDAKTRRPVFHLCYMFLRKVSGPSVGDYLDSSPHLRNHFS